MSFASIMPILSILLWILSYWNVNDDVALAHSFCPLLKRLTLTTDTWQSLGCYQKSTKLKMSGRFYPRICYRAHRIVESTQVYHRHLYYLPLLFRN
jgi:hypothetical protein